MFGEPILNPMGWSKKQLQAIVTDDCSISYGIVQTGEEQKKGVPVFRPVDIVNNRRPLLSELKKTTLEISDSYKRTILRGNEMLLTVRANIGDTCIIGKEFAGCNVGRGIVPIRTKEDEFNVKFLKYQLDTDGLQREMKNKAKGITLIQLNMSDLRELALICPEINLQNEFVMFAETTNKLKFVLQKNLSKIQDDFNTSMQKAFKGELHLED